MRTSSPRRVSWLSFRFSVFLHPCFAFSGGESPSCRVKYLVFNRRVAPVAFVCAYVGRLMPSVSDISACSYSL